MASFSNLMSEDQFQCFICLDVFNEPVATPCGHTFCKTCITKYWDDDDDLCQCPICKTSFDKRPNIFVNVFISKMAAQFRKSVQDSASSPDQQPARPGEVSCDICTGTKIKAMKSCLVCLASYCETHLGPHLRASALKKHKLVDPVENLEDMLCKKHERPLELFCRTDQVCVCRFCTEGDHKTHDTVPLEKEYRERKVEMRTKEADVRQMIQEREQKIQQIKHSIDLSKKVAKRDIADGLEVFAALVASVERSQAELVEAIEGKQRAAEDQAEGFIEELEREITELKTRGAELEQLSHTEDHLHLLQVFPSLSTPPPTKDWSGVSVHSDASVGMVRRAVAQLEETLAEETETLLGAELKRVREYAVDVTLDPDTAHPRLVLSDDGKRVKCGDARKALPDNPERFNTLLFVLAKQRFSSGRFYYEVQVKENVVWSLGVAKESINRKGVSALKLEDGYWAIWLTNGDYGTTTAPLSLRKKPQVIGVFVDYEGGQVSFYDVESRVHIYSYTGHTFTEKLQPYVCPFPNQAGENVAPLIIYP